MFKGKKFNHSFLLFHGAFMAEPKKLTIGAHSPAPSMHEEESRVAVLQATIEKYIPDFVKAVQKTAKSSTKEGSTLVLHQDSFAAGYHDDEYVLLGMAIKYAGLYGINISFIGKNKSTF
jgi:hypothetical protein